jgi:hypothetical protein
MAKKAQVNPQDIARIRVRRLTIFTLVVAASIFLLNVIIDNPYAHRIARVGINMKAEQFTRIKIDFRAVKLTAFPPGLDLYGLNVEHLERPGESIISAAHLRVRLSIWSLFLGTPELSSVELTDLETALPTKYKIQDLLKFQLEAAPGPITWPPKFHLPVDNIILRNASISIDLPGESPDKPVLRSHLNGADFNLRYAGWDDIYFSADLGNITLKADQYNILERGKLKISASLEGDKITTDKFLITDSDLSFAGNLAGSFDIRKRGGVLQSIGILVNGSADADIAKLGRILDISGSKGKLVAEIGSNIFIPIESSNAPDFAIQVDAESKNATLYDFKLLQSKASMHIDAKELGFKKIEIISGDRKVGEASGNIQFNHAVDYSFKFDTDRLLLTELLDALDVDSDVVEITMTTENAILEGRGDPFRMSVAGEVVANNIRLVNDVLDQRPPEQAPSCLLQLKLAIDDGSLNFTDTNGKCLSSDKVESKDASRTKKQIKSADLTSDIAVKRSIYFDEIKGIDMLLQSQGMELDLVEHYFNLDSKGKSKLEVAIVGPYERVKTKIKADSEDTVIEGVPLGRVQADVTVLEQYALISSVRAQLPAKGVILLTNSRVNFDDPLTSSLQISAADIPSTVVRTIFNHKAIELPLEFGINNFEGSVSLPLLSPLLGTGQLQVELNNLQYSGEKLFDQLRANLVGTDKGWQTDSFRSLSHMTELEMKFAQRHSGKLSPASAARSSNILNRFGLDQSDQFEVSGKLRHIAPSSEAGSPALKSDAMDLIALPFAGQFFREAGIDGHLSGEFAISGSFAAPQGTYSARVDEFRFQGSRLAPVVINGFLNDAKLDVIASQAGDAMQSRFSIDFKKDGFPYSLYAQAKRFDIRSLGTSIFYDDPRNYAYLSASLNLKGEIQHFWKSEGSLDINDFRAKYLYDMGSRTRSIDAKLTRPATLNLSRNGWNLQNDESLSIEGNLLQLRISTRKNRLPDALQLHFDAEVDMRLLAYFIPQVDTVSGKLLLTADLGGQLSDPKFSLAVNDVKSNAFTAANWTPVVFGLNDFRPALRNIELEASYDNQVFELKKFVAAKGSGSVSASGRMFFDPERADSSRIEVSMSGASLVYPVPVLKAFDTSLDGTLVISGSRFPLDVAGDINVVRARSVSEFDIRKNISLLRRRGFDSTNGPEKPLLNLDLRINSDNSIAISNRNIQTNLSSSLVVRGSEQNPNITGQIEIVRGKFIYKRDFNITQGILTFDDPLKIDPKLDISAFSDVGGYRVFIAVSGRASEPIVDLNIEPQTRDDGTPISKLAIVALLSSGSLPGAAGELVESQTAARTEAFNIFVADRFEAVGERVLDVLGKKVVRQVYVELVSDEEGRPLPTLSTPIQLGDDIEIVLRFGQGSWKVSSEYSIHDNISVLGSFDGRNETRNSTNSDDSDTGLDLRFRFNFQ